LVAPLGASALIAVLAAGCGSGGATPAKVETSLRDFISGMNPQEGVGPFPVDAGPPHLKHNSCRDRHITTKSGQVVTLYAGIGTFPKADALWTCVVTFGNSLTLPVDVLVKGSKVVGVFPRASQGAPGQSPATVYQGGPKQPKP
jgi:hypothetical protein